MDTFELLTLDEINCVEAGCSLCKIGGAISGASAGAGIVLALASNPAGWAIASGAIIGAGLGVLVVS